MPLKGMRIGLANFSFTSVFIYNKICFMNSSVNYLLETFFDISHVGLLALCWQVIPMVITVLFSVMLVIAL